VIFFKLIKVAQQMNDKIYPKKIPPSLPKAGFLFKGLLA